MGMGAIEGKSGKNFPEDAGDRAGKIDPSKWREEAERIDPALRAAMSEKLRQVQTGQNMDAMKRGTTRLREFVDSR